MRLLRLLGAVGFLLVVAVGCKKKPAAIAELSKAEGPVERQEGQGPWAVAPIGTKYLIGDAARTADGRAELKLAAGTAIIKMDKYTVLRFGGGKDGAAKIGVELGAIELQQQATGASKYGLDIGDVNLGANGTIRITARGAGKSGIELLGGTAQAISLTGETLELTVGQELDLDMLKGSKVEKVVDAGVDAAPVSDAGPSDAGMVADEGTFTITGKKAELLKAGSTKWEPLPAGGGKLDEIKGAKIRLGAGTTAKMTANNLTLAMAGGSRSQIADDLKFTLELGVGTASVPENREGSVKVPNGSVDLKGTATSGAEARLDVAKNGDAKVSVLKGIAKLIGPGNAGLDMRVGESATVTKAMIRQTAKIPDYYDMKVSVGGGESNFTIHDPKGATALQFAFGGKCGGGGGTIELDNDPSFRTARISAGKDAANIIAEAGAWSYRLVCNNGSRGGGGRVIVRRDAGTRPLPKDPPTNFIDADGRTYRISYQSVVPKIKVKVPGGGSQFKLHLATGGQDETFDSSKPEFTLDPKKLKEATYTYWVERDGVKQDKVSTLVIDFDQTAPQVYIEAPANGKTFGADVDVRGAVLPGWTAKVDVVDIPIDKGTRRFNAKVAAPVGAQALAIRLSHPQRGVHYYLRRGK